MDVNALEAKLTPLVAKRLGVSEDSVRSTVNMVLEHECHERTLQAIRLELCKLEGKQGE